MYNIDVVLSAPIETDTREVILDAFDSLMGRYGFRKMAMGDVAKEARMSRRTLYLHFRGKDDLGLSSIARVIGQVQEELREIAGGSGSVHDRLKGALNQRVKGRLSRVKDYAQNLDELFEILRPAYMELRHEFYLKELGIIEGLVREGLQNGEFRDCDPREIARSMILATNAFVPYSLSPEELVSDHVFSQLASMADLLLAGIAAPNQEKS